MPLNKDSIKKSLFEVTTPSTKTKNINIKDFPEKMVNITKTEPKYKAFDVKLTVLLTQEQLLFVEKFVKDIMKNRTSKKERITKNTVFRCLIDILAFLKIDLKNIQDEQELRQRIFNAIKN